MERGRHGKGQAWKGAGMERGRGVPRNEDGMRSDEGRASVSTVMWLAIRMEPPPNILS